MDILFVTCGISLATQSRCWKGCEIAQDFAPYGEIYNQPNCKAILDRLTAIRTALLNDLGADESQWAAKAEQIVPERFIPRSWDDSRALWLPAELTTLRRMLTLGWLRPETRIVLLSGTSNRRHAILLRAIIEFLVGMGSFPKSVVELAKPVLWDPPNPGKSEDVATFSAALESVFDVILESIQTSEGTVQIVLTGGYKSVLVHVALNLGRLGRTASKARIVNSFEDESSLMWYDLQDEPRAGRGPEVHVSTGPD